MFLIEIGEKIFLYEFMTPPVIAGWQNPTYRSYP
jgi:hypothetical protein